MTSHIKTMTKAVITTQWVKQLPYKLDDLSSRFRTHITVEAEEQFHKVELASTYVP